MYQVLDGVKVVEAAGYLFVPVAGAILADWGAEVIKIEHPRTGDPYRGLRNDYVKPGMPNPMLELPNHGKRSLGLDLASDEGRELMYELLPTRMCSSPASCGSRCSGSSWITRAFAG